MAAKLLQSLTDDNSDLQKQIGCMTGIFQLFDRQHVLTGGKSIVGHTTKRLPVVFAGKSHSSNSNLEKDSSNGQLRSASLEKYPNKNMQERQRVFTESSRASFSSSSRSSSFCSLDCNRTTQLEPTSFDGIIFPETPSRDSAMRLQDSSSHFSRQVIDLRHLVKDSMYREVQGSSFKAKSTEAMDLVAKHRDSPRPPIKTYVGSHGLSPEKSSVTPADLKESLRALAKLQEAPWYHNEPRELLRSASYHSKDGSSFSVSKDLPRFSYDGREMNRAPDVSKSSLKLKDLPRLSLDTREGSLRSLKADSKSKFFVKTLQKSSGEFDRKTQNLQQSPGNQARPPSVVAKLMGLETLPDSTSSSESNVGSSRSYQNEDFVNVSRSFTNTDSSKPIQLLSSSSSKNLWKEPSSPRWRNPDSSVKPMSWFPIEPAPWRQTDGSKSSQKPASRSTRGPAKTPNTIPTVYSEIEKRLNDLEFTQSGKDLRALKQILESMQAKGLLETEKEGQGSNFASHKDHEHKFSSPIHDSRLLNNRNSKTDQILASTKKRVGSGRNYESPIVIMKPAKLIEKSGIPAASVLSLDGFPGLPKNQDTNSVESRKGSSSGRTSNYLATKSNQRENAVTPGNLKNDRISKATQNSTSSQLSAKDKHASSGKSWGSISPRMQQKKAELEKRTRPLTTPPDSIKLRKQPNKEQTESVSPAGRCRPKNLNFHAIEEQPSEILAEPRNSSYQENENLDQLTKSPIHESRSTELLSSERSPSTCHRQYPSLKACELMLSGLAEKKSALKLNDEEAAGLACAPTEFSSPVSVLDNAALKDDSPSPAKYIGKTLKEKNANTVQGSSMTNCGLNSMEMSITSKINRKKLQNIENLVQKLRRINSSHDEARTDYIASLCENTDPDHRYISEILLASGLLLRDLGGSLANFQFHPSGHPINPDLFLVLEQTKASTLLKEERCNERTATQMMSIDKFHRKLIFDTVNEILTQRLALSEPWPRMLKPARKAVNALKLLKDLCSKIEGLRAETSKCGESDSEDDGWKNILCKDLTLRCESWTNFDDEISGPVLDIERLIFKDLVDEVVIGECTGLKTKSGRHRNHFSK
ncbi:protein LONGIFOLIA 1 isoform X3 [Primulina huaijiensis]|uniref:protein LONGIFOLIA 1 isoform X3 n=1 Tax=Primulina huaijiensis TaxID=1492673 RepID=UPI003CC7556A